jgi:cytochrome P450
MRRLLGRGQPQPALAIPAHLPGAGGAGESQADPVIANAVGLLMQAYEATAGLIGNSLLALAARPALPARLQREPALLQALLHEVLRYDPPVQNTRRYLARDALVAGQMLPGGALVLVVLAAANRDPAANPDPDRFDLLRADRQSFTFGAGAHACPGQRLAVAIAGAGVRHVLDLGLDLQGLAAAARYRPSLNTRVPVFT